MNLPSHGSNPHYLYEAMGLTLPNEYIDFSANINPLGPPSTLKEKWDDFFAEINVYPDPFGARLKKAIGEKEQISVDSILVGNGGSELITLTAQILAGKKVVIVQPAFAEYEKACLANDCEIRFHQLNEPDFELNPAEVISSLADADALFLCNPSNPTGIHYKTSTVLTIIDECEKQNCIVILDEAFYDFLLDYQSFIPCINKYSNLIIIRSMTKMFAIPGIRLGYLAAQPKMITELSRLQSHWSTNTIALLAGEICLQDESFIKESQAFIYNERKRLLDFYRKEEYVVSASKTNFYLLRDTYLKDQYELFKFLLHHGIIPRHTINFPGLEGNWLRFAIKSISENNQLIEVLKQWRQQDHSSS